MNFKDYQIALAELETELMQQLPFWEVRRFVPEIFLSNDQLYLAANAGADGMNAEELLTFIKVLIKFGAYTKEEVFPKVSEQDDDTLVSPPDTGEFMG